MSYPRTTVPLPWPTPRRHPRADLLPLGLLPFAYVTATILVATWVPFRFEWPEAFPFDFELRRADLGFNLLLFIPLGYVHRLTFRGRDRRCIDALVVGAAISMAVELVQLFLPSRCASPIDMLANAVGAWVGAHGHRLLGACLDRRLLYRLQRHRTAGSAAVVLWLGALLMVAASLWQPHAPGGGGLSVAFPALGSRPQQPVLCLLVAFAGFTLLGNGLAARPRAWLLTAGLALASQLLVATLGARGSLVAASVLWCGALFGVVLWRAQGRLASARPRPVGLPLVPAGAAQTG